MNRKGDLLIPFSLVLSALALLIGALMGNSIGRKNDARGEVSVLDVKPIHRSSQPKPSPVPASEPDPVLTPMPDAQP